MKNGGIAPGLRRQLGEAGSLNHKFGHMFYHHPEGEDHEEITEHMDIPFSYLSCISW